MMKIKRGDVFFADLDPVTGSEQGGVRPVLIIQNDIGNQHSPTTIVAAITGQLSKAKLPTHVDLGGRENGLSKNSVVLVEQVRTIDKQRLKERICSVDKAIMEQVDVALENQCLFINTLKKLLMKMLTFMLLILNKLIFSI